MEYLSNFDLKQFIKKYHSKNPNSQLSEILCGYFMIQILEAMFYLRSSHILHRDIKLENIMLSEGYKVKVGDFSLSKKIDDRNKFVTTRSGTLPYLAPECIRKKTELTANSCFKTDIFSLGIVMYWILFNSHPFQYKVSLQINIFLVINEHF